MVDRRPGPRCARACRYGTCRSRIRLPRPAEPLKETLVLLGALSFLSNDLAIDLGTANTCVFARG